jgi:hypothetical protein
MKFSIRVHFRAWYERLYTRRFKLENERSADLAACQSSPVRRRFSIKGAIFPTETTLPRYQY